MGAAEEVSSWSFRIDLKTLSQKFPDLRKHSLWPGDFEVVDIYDDEHAKIRVKEARWPVRDGDEATFDAVSVAFFLPKGA